MKKYSLLLQSVLLLSCSGKDEETEVSCNCVKTSYHFYFATSSSNSSRTDMLGRENVPCQVEESQVTTATGKGGERWYYVICCSNLNDLERC